MNYFMMLTWLFSCDGDSTGKGTDSAPTDTDTDTDTDTTDTGEDDAVCYERETENGPPDVITCELPTPCDDITYMGCDVDNREEGYDPTAGACLLSALENGQVGSFTIASCPGGQVTERWHIASLGDGTVLWSNWGFDDSVGYGSGSWRALPDKRHFEACSAENVDALHTCLDVIPEQSCQLGVPTCP